MKKKYSEDLIKNLITEITPYNNKYRLGIKDNLKGTYILEIMWDVGNIMKKYKIDHVHNIAWKIYGKSKNIRRSYITRDFLSYCYRVRRLFKKKSDIRKQFPNLSKYSLFREAFPLLDNPEYNITGKEKKEIITILNSNIPFKKAKELIIKKKRSKKIIKNPRTQRLKELEEQVSNFISLYKELKNLYLEQDINDILTYRKQFKDIDLKNISKFCIALSQEGFYFPNIEYQNGELPDLWKNFISSISFFSNKSVETRNRFRRIVGASKIINMAEMMNSLIDIELIKNMKIKIKKEIY